MEIKMNYAIPDLSDANIPMRQIAEEIVKDSRRNIRKQKAPDGTPFESLKEKTVNRKRNKGFSFPSRALFAKGIMYRAIHAYKLSKNRFAVGVIARGKPRRDLLAIIHQEQGPVPGQYIRPFLGISTKVQRFARDRMNRWVRQKLEKAPKKAIKITLT